MTIVSTILLTATLILSAVHMIMRYKMELQMMQQNSYRNNRYFKWWKTNPVANSGITDYIVLCLILIAAIPKTISLPIAILVFAANIISASKKKSKKPLVFTKRVWRLFSMMILLSIFFCLGTFFGFKSVIPTEIAFIITVAIIILCCLSWIVVMLANWVVKPVESAINRKYYNDAKRLLSQMPDMKIIGITGSYGKTSTKHYLYRILCEQYNVLMTPGSFNTPMGVIRTVREMMKPYNDVFIVEMGAKQIGDIKEICDLVHPQMGIITAVGEQHLESFKTIENVQRTKFELADALPADGLVILNNDFEYVENRPVSNTKALRYAVAHPENADYHVSDIEYSEYGTKFTIIGKDINLRLETKLVGECNISNLTGAVIAAVNLGVSQDKIKYAVSQIEQVEHRLNMKRTAGGVTIIDDAFNSNPDGSRMALDVLSRMTKGKRIVVTPGMIELGDKQDFYNEKFGEHIAETCDVAIVVGQYNRVSIVKGIKDSGKFDENNLHIVDSFAAAQTELGKLLRSGDTVLYENDLPDTFK